MNVWMHAELRLARADALPELADWLRGPGAAAMGRLGGALWGCWPGAPGFGLRSDAVLLSTTWPDDAAAGAATELLAGAPPVIGVDGTPLHATERPATSTPVAGEGLWVFREFELARADSARFVELSERAWATFEARFDARIDGLFRAPDPTPDAARMLLVTRYADLGTWQASPSAEADPESWSRFVERRGLTRWTRACCAPRLAL